MNDMLVRLYDFYEDAQLLKQLEQQGFDIRRPLAAEKSRVLDFVRENFGDSWASECDVSFSREPFGCYIAVYEGKTVGFACYESCYKNFFGPTGVMESLRGKQLGKALLGRCLNAMKEMGYGYAIIGGVGPADFYSHCCGAFLIEGSSPGIYKGMLK